MIKPFVRNLAYIQNTNIKQGQGNLEGAKVAEAFNDVGTSIGNVANQMAASPNGDDIVPPNIGAVQAQHLGNGLVDIAITDNGQIQRAVDYVVEIADNSGFSNSRTVHFSPSRNASTVVPNGTYYVKAYSQYRLGGPPSQPLTSGPIQVSGSASGAMLGGQGCGVAAPGTTGQGAGTQISR